MKAAVLRDNRLVVANDIREPEITSDDDVIVSVKACGICGSDLHFVKYAADMLGLIDQMEGMPGAGRRATDLSHDVHLGHEFAAEVIDPGKTDLAVGTLVTSLPTLASSTSPVGIGYGNNTLAGFGERMVLSASVLLKVPNGLPAHYAALTEPLAVGLHAVSRAEMKEGQGALVIGCGPVGLAIIAELSAAGVAPIVAADFSPKRRELAGTFGAHGVVNPAEETIFAAWKRVRTAVPPVVFDAVGAPGMLNENLRVAPWRSRIVIAGVLMRPDTVTPYFGVVKELDVRFAFAYNPKEFALSLSHLAEGVVDPAPFVTGRVPLDDIASAFDALGDPETHCKIIVEPGLKI